MDIPLLSIRIGIDPDMFEIGTFVLTWHGFFTFVAVSVAVFLVGRWAKKAGMVTDAVYSVAVWAIIGGIIGTRVFHVVDFWDVYQNNPGRIVQIWQGGITIWGAILGGFLGGAAYMVVRNHPRFIGLWNRLLTSALRKRFTIRGLTLERQERLDLREAMGGLAPIKAFNAVDDALEVSFQQGVAEDALRALLDGAGYSAATIHSRRLERAPLPTVGQLADLTTPALLIAMAIGRVGDIINGEHVAKLTSLPWGFVYTHIESPSNAVHTVAASHPAVVYEMLWDLAVLGLVWGLKNRLRPPGMLFALYLASYSVGKFFISFLRLDKEWAIGLAEAHFVAIAVMAITIPLLIAKAQFVRPPSASRAQGAKVGS